MKQRAIFIFYHGLGHVNSFLKTAKFLEASNYEVYFAGSGFFQKHITLQGCKFYLLKSYPFGVGLEKWINVQDSKKSIYFSALWDRITDRVFTERQVDLYWMLEGLKPAVVLIDKMLSTDFIALYPHLKNREIRVAVINTMLPTEVTEGRSPLNSDVLPTESQATLKAIQKMNWNKRKTKWKQKLMMLGFDDSYIISRSIRKNVIPQRYISNNADLLSFALNNIDEFILAPCEFDFPHIIPRPNQRYIGFMVTAARVETVEKAYEDIVAHIVAQKKEKHLKLIYCSFGTVAAKQRKVTAAFVRKLASIAADDEFIVVISGEAGVQIVTEATKNFYAFRIVPQLEILRNADVFVTHGGLNSIKEAVYAEVPMLVYPVHREYDPHGNAARVFYHGLGLRGDASSDCVNDIRLKIKQLLSNKTYFENLRRLKNIDSSYTAASFVDAIDRLTLLR